MKRVLLPRLRDQDDSADECRPPDSIGTGSGRGYKRMLGGPRPSGVNSDRRYKRENAGLKAGATKGSNEGV